MDKLPVALWMVGFWPAAFSLRALDAIATGHPLAEVPKDAAGALFVFYMGGMALLWPRRA